MSERLTNRAYWTSTVVLAALMLLAGVQDVLRAEPLLEAIRRLGYPDYLLTIVGIGKLVGAPLLVQQRMPRLKEWVYAGFAFDFGGATVSHMASGDTLVQTLPAVLCSALLLTSYVTYRARSRRNPG